MSTLSNFKRMREQTNKQFVEKLIEDAKTDPDCAEKLDALKEFHRLGKLRQPAWYTINPWFDFDKVRDGRENT